MQICMGLIPYVDGGLYNCTEYRYCIQSIVYTQLQEYSIANTIILQEMNSK